MLVFFDEDLSSEARVLAESDAVFSAPDMILTECANAVWRRVVSRTVSRAHAQAFLKALPQWFELLTPSAQLHEAAFEMACVLEHPVYDCQYLALAENKGIQAGHGRPCLCRSGAPLALAGPGRESRWRLT